MLEFSVWQCVNLSDCIGASAVGVRSLSYQAILPCSLVRRRPLEYWALTLGADVLKLSLPNPFIQYGEVSNTPDLKYHLHWD